MRQCIPFLFTDFIYCGNEQLLWSYKNAVNYIQYRCKYAICND